MNHHHHNLQFLACFLALLISSQQQCTLPAGSNDLLQSGSTIIQNSFQGNRQNLFTITLNNNIPTSGLQMAASTSTLSYTETNGLDFSVSGYSTPGSGTATLVLLMNQNNNWNQITVFYLISARSDFSLGFYIAGVYLLSMTSNTLNIQFNIPNWVNSQSTFTSIVQFSGVTTSSNVFTIYFSGVNLNAATGVLTTVVTINAGITVENIYLTYIILAQSSPIKYSYFSPQQSPYPGTYNFIGIEKIDSSSPTFAGSAFIPTLSNGLICVGSSCPSACVSSSTCTSLSGQISGNYCYICAAGQTLVNGVCQSNCGQNQVLSGTQCICVNGYVMVGGVCYLSCGVNAYYINNQCICLPGYTFSTSANQCVANSPCSSDRVLVNGVCICQPNSSSNSQGQCICNTGRTRVNGVCVCAQNSSPNSQGQCICNIGYTQVNGICVLSNNNCPIGMIFNGVSCVCPAGQYISAYNSNLCTSCNGLGQAVQGNTCVCLPAFYPTASGCSSCPQNTVFNSQTNQCVCAGGYVLVNGQCVLATPCPAGSVWNSITSSCQCQGNSNFNGFTCVCNTGYYLIGGNCVACDPNSVYVPSQSTCVCNSGFYGNWQLCTRCDPSCSSCSGSSSNQCTGCPTSSTLNSAGQCITGCPSGQFLNAGVCTPCMANCILCQSATLCTTCAQGYRSSLTVVNGNVVTICALVPTGTTSTIALTNYVVGNSVVYQGVTMSLMPTSILAAGCTICNDLLLVNVVSSYSSITTTVEFVANSQYWFLIKFDFTGAPFIPTFQFTVQINPTHAASFTSQDMAQKLFSALSPTTTYQSGNLQPAAPPSSGSPAVFRSASAQLSSSQILAKVFGPK